MHRRLLVAAFSIILFACGGESATTALDGPHPQRTSEAIINGTVSTSAQDAVVALGIYVNGTAQELCSGTLVAPNLVATARHCVSEIDAGAIGCSATSEPVVGGRVVSDRAPADLLVYTGTLLGQRIFDPSLAAARGAQLVVPSKDHICNGDVAFIVLDAKVTTPYAPIRLAGGPKLGEALTVAGFGLTELGALPSSRMQRTGVTVGLVGPAASEDGTAGIGDSEFLVREAACHGDSGGAALSASGALVGITSRVGGGSGLDPSNPAVGCVGPNVQNTFSDLRAFADLASRAFAAAQAKPWLEGEELPPTGRAAGALCTTDNHCATGLCDGNACAASCATDACAAGSSCKVRGDLKVCVKNATAPAPSHDPTSTPPTASPHAAPPPASVPSGAKVTEVPGDAPPAAADSSGGCTTARSARADWMLPMLAFLGMMLWRRRSAVPTRSLS